MNDKNDKIIGVLAVLAAFASYFILMIYGYIPEEYMLPGLAVAFLISAAIIFVSAYAYGKVRKLDLYSRSLTIFYLALFVLTFVVCWALLDTLTALSYVGIELGLYIINMTVYGRVNKNLHTVSIGTFRRSLLAALIMITAVMGIGSYYLDENIVTYLLIMMMAVLNYFVSTY
ncbi:hypothetical protein [Candidatus Methanomassiliicoccus intestinalis]|uniref:hypothetical protein n=1 Tax=Candidatus Methanomassiliicoccus intestinalis TaxID=1406512 RepID=UPI0037DC5536